MPYVCNKLYGLIGKPLTHSFSAEYFNRKFETENIDACYCNFELDTIDVLPELVAEHPYLCGFNVTSPYKREIFKFLNSVSPLARQAEAVNVVRVERNADGAFSLHGFNSDVPGFSGSLRGFNLSGMKALILGSGGAATACRLGFRQLGINSLIVSRSRGENHISYDDVDAALMDEHRIIVNATPLGMHPYVGIAPPIPYEYISPEHLAYDLVYNPGMTEFLRRAEARGAKTKNGLEMLLLQADESWLIWNKLNKDK